MTRILQIENITKDEFLSAFSGLVESAVESALAKREAKKGKPSKFTVKQLAEKYPISESSLRNWIRDGKIKADKIGGKVLVDESEIENSLTEIKSLKYKR